MDGAKVTEVERQPLPETPDVDGAYPRLSDQQIGMLAAHGERRPTRAGDHLLREGERSDEFLVLLRGSSWRGVDQAGSRSLRWHGG